MIKASQRIMESVRICNSSKSLFLKTKCWHSKKTTQANLHLSVKCCRCVCEWRLRYDSIKTHFTQLCVQTVVSFQHQTQDFHRFLMWKSRKIFISLDLVFFFFFKFSLWLQFTLNLWRAPLLIVLQICPLWCHNVAPWAGRRGQQSFSLSRKLQTEGLHIQFWRRVQEVK